VKYKGHQRILAVHISQFKSHDLKECVWTENCDTTHLFPITRTEGRQLCMKAISKLDQF